ncbi:M3 family metallopeptidase [Legionella micdadei]|uniref:oligopeptidase A n=1 Tax=Legionella micdadei TaxID=451 RepID=A0A098GIA3_LEGMI|nr:M3 family metallopeptidase [Legionella micdadei]ARG98630.1 oligopeptidase A [Legionella micdadei]KTD28835.1 oligopeptidase A [Legionella micdadei]CEG62213.1 Oligopeptidase A [Legionella micdadei]SCY07183.1 oligopeptidase A [Legionella micdadei]
MSAVSLPQFTSFNTEHFVEHLDKLLQTNLEQIEVMLRENTQFTWNNLMKPLEDMDDALERFWAPLSHLHAVVNSKKLRDCYQACLPKLSAYEAAIGHNHELYSAIKSLDKTVLNETQCKIVEDGIRDFELSGVALPTQKKQRFEEIQTRLSQLSNQFENNVLDATQAFSLHITDEKRLAGLPEHAVNTAYELAGEKGVSGWMLNLEFPCYLAVVTYAEDRALREEMYYAFATRASDQGPSAGKFDNTTLIDEMLDLRQEKAELLGFANYAELSLATKMADSTKQVLDFLHDLSGRSHHQAETEFQSLQEFAQREYGIDKIAPWDLAFLSEKKSQKEYAISQEELRPYFSLNKVMEGLFTVVNKLYGMNMEEITGVDTWHPDVKCYRVLDEDMQLRGYIYVDLFARQHKRGGAWMDSLQSRRKLADGDIQLPIATLTCNFAKPSAKKPAALSHDEVLTLFHEFGHCLHHVLTKVDYLNASGINGVEWDAVELPSQFFENWCWEHSAIQLLTQHVDSGEKLPDELFNKLVAAKNFQSAMAMMRQLEFALFDFRIHQEFKPGSSGLVAKILNEVRKETTVVPVAPYNRFQHSFTHIFSGGYAAGYYSYKWAEVLSSDAFSRFEEEGILNPKTGRDFLHLILEVGGSKKAADAYLQFRGRPATVDALLRHNGIH